jgi:GNAT superfamily N-acetyltransferase
MLTMATVPQDKKPVFHDYGDKSSTVNHMRAIHGMDLPWESQFSSDDKSPLDYHGAPVHRDALTHGSEHGPGYFSEKEGAQPGTKAFVDWQKAGPDAHYIHYMAVHPGHRGQGLAHQVVEQHIQAHPGLKELDFGKLMEPEMQSVVDRVKKNHPDLNVRSKVYYR